MMILVTLFALVKDVMFNNISTLPHSTLSTSSSTSADAFVRRIKPKDTTVFGLLCTLLVSLSLITLHTKGALPRIVAAVSSTDFLTTTDIIHSTLESITTEIMSVETIPSNFRQSIHAEGQGVLEDSHFVTFCGNPKNIFQSPHNAHKSEYMYLKFDAGIVTVHKGRLHFKQLGFPLKYLYYIATYFIPVHVEGNLPRLPIWSSQRFKNAHKMYYKVETSTNPLRLYTSKYRKQEEKVNSDDVHLIPFRAFYLDRRCEM